MAKLFQLEEAAKLLGIGPDQLVELRSRGEIHGYRDGSTWKFKESEIERYAAAQGVDVGAAGLPPVEIGSATDLGKVTSDIDADLDELVDVAELDLDDDTDGPESLLVTDDDSIGLDPTSSSTIIGKPGAGQDPASDLVLSDNGGASGVEIVSDGSELKLVGDSGGESEINLDEGLSESAGGSSAIKLTPGSGVGLTESDSEIDLGSPADSGSELKLVDSSPQLGEGGSDILLDDNVPDDPSGATGELTGASLSAEDDVILDSSLDLNSSLNLSDEELELSVGSSSEISLDGSDIGLAASDTGVGVSDSDVTLDASDSGINLGSPADSGISLEQTPPEISVSGDEALELGEASLDDLGDGLDASMFEEADDLEADADFLLTPVEGDADEADSGSQVIALDTEELDEEGATLLQGAEVVDSDDADFAGLPDDEEAPLAAGVADMPESGYTLWQVLGLGMIMLPLGLGGLMIVDLMRNMWSWNGNYSINSDLMDLILSMFPK